MIDRDLDTQTKPVYEDMSGYNNWKPGEIVQAKANCPNCGQNLLLQTKTDLTISISIQKEANDVSEIKAEDT